MKTDVCPICDVLLDWSRKGKTNRKSPTIDRINGDKTLRMDNILIICYMCNSTKQERTMTEFVTYCKKIVEKFG